MKIKDLRNELKNLSNEEKDSLIIDLFKTFKDVKRFLDIKHSAESKDILFEEVREKIKKEFDLKYINSRWRFSVVKSNIWNYKKVSWDIHWTIRLYIFYLKVLLNFMSEVWNWEQLSDAFYNSFNQTVKLINAWWYWEEFIKDMKIICNWTEGYWWWVDAVYDLLNDIKLN